MTYKYDVALSFAGENRDFAESVASGLKAEGVKVFYDEFSAAVLWGEDLAVKFKEVYFADSRYCIMILSDHYVQKMWPTLERRTALERFIKESGNAYILPVRLDGFSGDVPGFPNTVGYLSVKSNESGKVVDTFLQKIEQNKIYIYKAEENSFSSFQFSTGLVDQKIEEEIGKLRRSRFFIGPDTPPSSLHLAQKLAEGEFSSGSGSVRSWALAWCVRMMLSDEKLLQQAEDYLSQAKSLGVCTETEIAEAFIYSRKGDKTTALGILADIDLPVSRTAALMIVAKHEGGQGAIDWLKNAQIDTVGLDSEGKYFLLMNQLELAHWDLAQNSLDSLSEEDFRKEEPALFYMVAMAYLLKAVPEKLRASIFSYPPFNAAEFSLDSSKRAIKYRSKAREYFMKAAEIAQRLNCNDAAKICEEYAFWLELRDPDKQDEARQLLQAKLHNPETALHLVRLGIQFGLKLNFQTIEREIKRQTALRGEITFDGARARLAVVLAKETPEDIADDIKRYENELERYFDKKWLRFLLIEILSKAGFAEQAKEYLTELRQEGISDFEYEYIQDIISEPEQTDTTEFAKKRFKEADSLESLIALVKQLDWADKFEDLCEYADILFKRTGSLPDAEKLVKSLVKTRKTQRLVEFVKENSELLEQSEKIKKSYCWGLFHEGQLIESRSLLRELNYDWDDQAWSELRTGLAISLGDWNELEAFVGEEFSRRDQRTPLELIKVAELAALLKLPSAKDVTKVAAEKAGDDPDVLAAAYFLASKAGWENDTDANQWLEKAVSLSGDDGPAHPVSLEDALNMKSEGDQRWSETLRQYLSGDIPIFLVAYSSHSSVFDLTFFPAIANLSETDPRKRRPVLAYSGKRNPMEIETDITLGLDATALITLSFLDEGLLDKIFDVFRTVRIPHSTLAWLFEEKRRIEFHQPSRIKDARTVRDLLVTHKIEELKSAVVPDADLAFQVRSDLAVLITEAEKSSDDHTQHLVVCSSPVYHVASLMDEEVDLTAHEAVLCGCVSVIDKLRQKGRITDREKKKAYDYMGIHEKPWPNQPEVTDGAVLYLDELTVEHFLHLGILGELKEAGFRAIVSPGKVSSVDEFLSYEKISGKGIDIIENIRRVLNSGIMSGKVKVSRQFNTQAVEGDILCSYLADIFSLTSDCDAIVIDDRYFNKNPDIRHGGSQALTVSTWDVLGKLWSSDSITLETLLDYITRLCRAGYFFIPVVPSELRHHIDCSTLQNGKFEESPGLRAIRENILCVKMNDCLQFPEELPWVDAFITAFITTLKGFWTADADLARVRALSDWILESVDILGWFRSLADRNKENMDEIEFQGQGIVRLLFPMKISQEMLEEYWKWAESKILVPIKTQCPDLHFWLLEWYRQQVSRSVKTVTGGELDIEENGCDKSEWALAALQLVPPSFQNILLQDQSFCEEYGFNPDPAVSFGPSTASFKRSELCNAVQSVLSGVSVEKVIDNDGKKWELKNVIGENGLPNMALFKGDMQYPVPPSFVLFSPDRKTRLHFLKELASMVNLPSGVEAAWRKIFRKRAIKDGEIQTFERDIANTPVNIQQFIHNDINIRTNGKNISSWVPSSEKYFDRLVGGYDGSASIHDYASGRVGKFFHELSVRYPYEGFLRSLFLSSHSLLTRQIHVESLSEDDLVRAFDFLEKSGDRVSQTGAIEVGLRILPSAPEIEPHLVRLIKQLICDNAVGEASDFKLLSALFFFVYSELSRTRTLSSEPPFYRRLAALSQASMIHRQLANSDVEVDLLCEDLFRNCFGPYYIQSLVDMRVEPGWNPIFGAAEYIKANFLYRIIRTAEEFKRGIQDSEDLSELVFGTETESIYSHVALSLFSCHMNPLDGTEIQQQEMPAAVSSAIEKQIGLDEVSPLSFVALFNSAYVFQIDSAHAEAAAKALKSCGYQIANTESKSDLTTVLNGLAMVVSVTRSQVLADELRILVRRSRLQYTISAEEELFLCLALASSYDDPNEWRKFVGDWIIEIAFELKTDDVNIFRSQLNYLCHVVPDLRVSCDRAYAALNSVNN